MPNEKKLTSPVQPSSEPAVAKPTEESLRLATLLKQEQILAIEATGFMAGAGLKSTDRMTRSAFLKRFNTWRNQLAGKETR